MHVCMYVSQYLKHLSSHIVIHPTRVHPAKISQKSKISSIVTSHTFSIELTFENFYLAAASADVPTATT